MPTDHRTNSVRPAAAVKRPPLLGKSGGGCCLLQLDPHYSSSRYLPMMADEGTYVCKAFSPRSYVIQKVGPSPPSPLCIIPEVASLVHSHVDHQTQRPGKENILMNGETVVMPSPVALPSEPSTACESSASDVLSTSSNSTLPVESAKMNGEQQSRNVQMDPPTVQSPTGDAPSLERLKQLLAAQLEYYFSRDNLANDAYLVSQMDGDQYVPIWTVANFNQIKKLTTDIKLITEVLKESPNVQVDDEEMRVRPSHKRCIVILREIDGSTPAEEVRAIFEKDETLPKMLSCDYAHNNVWYLTFESDDDAQKAYHYIRDHVKEYKGQPINARIKAKPQLNRFYGLPASGVPGGPIPPGLAGLVSPAAVPLPVPLILAATPGAPLPVAVAPVVPNPLATAAAVAAVAAAATTSTPESSLKNGFSPSSSAGTPPPPGESPLSSGNSNPSVVTVATSQSQQQPHAQTHHHQQQSQQQQHLHHAGQQPRFIYAGPPNGGSPYGAQPPLQLYAFHPHPSSFYTPTVLQAWPSTTATGTPFFDLGSVFAMNGLSPQATFKPSPNPRYPNVSGGRLGGRGGGAGSGLHRRNPAASATPSSGVGHQHSSSSFQGTGGNPVESFSHTATAPAVNGPVGSTATAAPPSKTANSSSRPIVSGTSAPAVSSTSTGATAPNTATAVSPSAGRDNSNQEASVSTTSHLPIQKQAATDGHLAGGGGYGSHSSSGEERRHEQHNERNFGGGDRQSYGFGGRGGRGRPRGDRGNRGGYSSYYRGAGNGSYRGGGGGERERSDPRHSNSYGTGGSYQSRSMNGPSSHSHHHHQSMQQQHQQPLAHQQHQSSSYAGGGGGNHSHHSVSSSATSPAPDFDLQAESSFPPLPGLEAGNVGTTSSAAAASSATNSASSGSVAGNAETAHKVGDESGPSAGLDAGNGNGGGGGNGGNPVPNISVGGAWGESKLSDVVKGVAKPKSTGYHHNNNYGHGKPLLNGPVQPVVAPVTSTATTTSSKPVTETPAPSVPAASLPNGDLAQSTLALTPPTSPGKGGKESNKPGFPNPPSTGAPTVVNNSSTKPNTKTSGVPPQTSSPPLPSSSVEASKSGPAPTPSTTAVPPPSVSYAKIAEQNKDRIEQIARESKERDLELERERRRVASQNKVAANQGNKAGNRPGPATSGQAPAATSAISSNSIPAGPSPSNQHQRRKENSTSSDVVVGGGSRDRSKSPQ